MRTGALSLLVACVAAACLAQADKVPSYLDITIEKQPDGGIVYVVNAEGGLRRKDLERRLDSFKEAADAQGKEVRARLRAASTLPYRDLMSVHEVLKAKGITSIEFVENAKNGGKRWGQRIEPLPQIDPRTLSDALRLRLGRDGLLRRGNETRARKEWHTLLQGGKTGTDGVDPRTVVLEADAGVPWKDGLSVLTLIAEHKLHRLVLAGDLEGRRVHLPATMPLDASSITLEGKKFAIVGPQTRRPTKRKEETLILIRARVDAEGVVRYVVNGSAIPNGEALLRSLVFVRLKSVNASFRVRLRASSDLKYADVLGIVDVARRASIPSIEFLAPQSEAPR